MSSHFLVDKSLFLEAQHQGVFLEGARSFAEPGIDPNYGPDRGFVLAHIDLALDIDPMAQTMAGTAKLQIEPLLAGLGDVVLDLEDVTVSSVTDVAGNPLKHQHRSGKLLVEGLPDQGGTISVSYAGKPRRGLYFTGPNPANPNRQQMAWTQCQDEDGHFVFPCIDHPSVKVPFTIQVTAPEGYSVVGNGRLASQEGNTWRWVQEDPIPAYLFTVVVARLTTVTDQWRDRPVTYHVPEGTEEAEIRKVFDKTPRMLEFLSKRYGYAYPWPRYAQAVVHDFIFGGMENVAATTLTDLVMTDERARLDWDAEDLIAHELAHQWFGDLVTCQDWSQGWLNEGWATYSEHLWKTEDLGQDEADHALYEQLTDYMSEDGGRYRRPIVSYLFRNPIDMFDRHLYEKGALVLHTMRNELGEQAFWAGTKHYLHTMAHRTAHTRDFQRAMEAASGRNLDGFFQQWVLGAGHPELSIKLRKKKGNLEVSVSQTQTGPDVAEAFALTLPLVIVQGDQSRVLQLRIEERERVTIIPLDHEPDRIDVDPQFTFLGAVTVDAPREWMMHTLAHCPGVIGRMRAATALRKEGSPAALTALSNALGNDPFWGVRAHLAKELSTLGTDQARDVLLDNLGDAHPKSRGAIVNALSAFRSHVVGDALAKIISDGDPSYHVEGNAVRALGRIRDPHAVALCQEVLTRDSWGDILRCRALEGLGTTRNADSLPILLAWTSTDKSARAQAAAASALGLLSDEVVGCRSEAVDRLMEMSNQAAFRVRLAAIAALGRARDRRGLAVLGRIHRHDLDGRVARQAFEASRKLGTQDSQDHALAGLRDQMEALSERHRALTKRLMALEEVGD